MSGEVEARQDVCEFKIAERGKIILVRPKSERSWFLERGYGETDKTGFLVLSPVETLYLVEVGKIRVEKEQDSGSYRFEELVNIFSRWSTTFWRDFVIYRDLRKRRYVVKDGFSDDLRFRLFERGEYGEKPAKYVVIPIQEGREVSIEHLLKLIKTCRSMNKEPIIAVVDRRNEIVYYSASQVELRNV